MEICENCELSNKYGSRCTFCRKVRDEAISNELAPIYIALTELDDKIKEYKHKCELEKQELMKTIESIEKKEL